MNITKCKAAALMVAAGVIFIGSEASAESKTWSQADDLSTFEYTSTPPTLESLCLQANRQKLTWWLSKDADYPYLVIENAPYDGGAPTNPDGTNVINLMGHTLGVGQLRTRVPGTSHSRYSIISNGVINVTTLYGVGGDGKNQLPMTTIFDNAVVNVTNALYAVYDHSASTNIFSNGAVLNSARSGNTVTLFKNTFSGDTLQTVDNAMIFSSGSRFYAEGTVTIDTRGNASTTAGIRASNPNSELRFTGVGTSFDTGKILLGNTLPRTRIVLDDHATGVSRSSGIQIGYGANGLESELQILNGASFTNRSGLTIGTAKGADNCKVLVRNAELVCQSAGATVGNQNIYVNWNSNNSELELDNAKVIAQTINIGYGSNTAEQKACTGGVLRIKGTCDMKLNSASQLQYQTSGNEIIFDGATVLKPGSSTWYVNWFGGVTSTTNNRLRVINGSDIRYTSFLLGKQGASGDVAKNCVSGLVEIVDSAVELTTQFHQSGSYGTFVLDNSTLTIPDINGFGISVSNETYTTHDVSHNRAIFKGAAPHLYCTASGALVRFYNAGVEIDLSEAPVAGYANPVVDSPNGIFSIGAEGSFALTGVAAFATRLAQANVHKLTTTLIKASNAGNLDFPSAKVAEVNAALAGTSFTLVKSSGSVNLVYDDNYSPAVAYVSGEDAANTPAWPYDTWEIAAHTIKDAVNAAAVDGSVKVLGGFYKPAADNSGYGINNGAKIYAVADMTENPADGVLTITNRLFGGNLQANYDPFDPNVNVFNFFGGVCDLKPLPSGNFFFEYSSNGGQRWTNIRATFSGENTKLVSTNAITTYFGYLNKGAIIKLTDGAEGIFTSAVTIGGYIYGGYNTLWVENGAVVNSSVRNINVSSGGGTEGGNRLVVSNGTVNAEKIIVSTVSNYVDALEVRLAGSTPKINCSAASIVSEMTIGDNCALCFDMGDALVGGYAAIPLEAGKVVVPANGHLVIEGLATLVERMQAANVARTVFTLAKAKAGANYLMISDEAIAEAQASLPANCRLYKDGANLKLKVVAQNIGFLIMVQ